MAIKNKYPNENKKSQNKGSKSPQVVSPRPVAPKNLKEETQALPQGKVKMRFKEHKFYNDLDTPMFYAGEVYELEGAEWIQRWLKRGGEIVEGNLEFPVAAVNESEIVDNSTEAGKTDSETESEVVDSKEEEKPESQEIDSTESK